MILFVFEGARREVEIFNVLKRLFWGSETVIVSVYDCSIDALYQEMIKIGDDADIAGLLMARYKGRPDNPFASVTRSDDFSEIYLVFDYDFHDTSRTVEQLNSQLFYLLDYFKEETDKGKLYINYPMVEAIAYTKKLPDSSFDTYTVGRLDCKKFKQLAAEFSFYPNYDFIRRSDDAILKENWLHLRSQNVKKARMMCRGEISQREILASQVQDYECQAGCQVAILSGFALLLYDWLGY